MTSVKKTTAPRLFGPDVRARYLDLIRAGHGRHSACRAVGVSVDTYKRFYRASEEFREQVADAEEEAAEPVEAKLYEAAKNGEPWAVKEWLSKRLAGRWGDPAHRVQVEVSGTVTHELTAGPALERVAALAAQLEDRRRALAEAGQGVLDVPGEGRFGAVEMQEGPDGVFLPSGPS